MADGIEFSTSELQLVCVYPGGFDELEHNITIVSESVEFVGDRHGIATIFRHRNPESLKSLDNVIYVFDKSLAFYYDYNFWAKPFTDSKFETNPDETPNDTYKATIVINPIYRETDGRLGGGSHYGVFWYDAGGILKVVGGDSFAQGSPSLPNLKFRRMQEGNWQAFRLLATQPEVEILDGQEMELDGIISSLTHEAQRFKFHQRTLTGDHQKTIEVPSRIDIPRWTNTLNTLGGAWTKALTEFPSRIVLSD